MSLSGWITERLAWVIFFSERLTSGQQLYLRVTFISISSNPLIRRALKTRKKQMSFSFDLRVWTQSFAARCAAMLRPLILLQRLRAMPRQLINLKPMSFCANWCNGSERTWQRPLRSPIKDAPKSLLNGLKANPCLAPRLVRLLTGSTSAIWLMPLPVRALAPILKTRHQSIPFSQS